MNTQAQKSIAEFTGVQLETALQKLLGRYEVRLASSLDAGSGR